MTSVFFSVCFAIGALTSVYEDRPSIEYETVAKNSLAEVKAYRDKLIEIQRRVKSEFAARPDAYQAERIQKRHSMAVRCCDFVARNADKGDATGCGFAERGLEDLASFIQSFEMEFECWRQHPDNPQVKPVELDIRDFGAKGDGETDFAGPFASAMSAIRELGGNPCVLRIPAGDYVTRQCPGIAQMVVWGVTNCLVCGEGPDKTRIRFGVFAEPGLRVQYGWNVTFRGIELGMERLPFFQGEILANEKEQDSIVVRQTPGTLAPDDPCWTNRVRQQYCSAEYDPKTGRICKDTTWTSYACESERLTDGSWRLKFDPKLIYSTHRLMRPGNVMVLPFRYNSKSICYCVGGRLVTFDDVVIRSSHSSAFGGTGTHLLSLVRCKVLPMPGMYISSNADGCIAPGSTYIAHCDFRNMGDDGVNLHTRGVRVREQGMASNAFDLWNKKGRKGLYVLIDQMTGAHRGNFHENDTLPDDSVGKDQIYLAALGGTGGVVTDCRFFMNRGAGLVIQSPNVLVGDVEVNGASGGVRVGNLMRAIEGPGPYNCLFRNVRVSGGRRGFFAEFETQKSRPAQTAGLRAITWEGCVAQDSEEPLRLHNVGDSVLSDCVFKQTGKRSSVPMRFCEDVSLVRCTMNGLLLTEKDIAMESCRNVSARSPSIKVTLGKEMGPVKPVNGVGQPPMIGAPTHYRMMHYLKEAGIPYSRLHDVGGVYGQFRYVDVPNIFLNFDADETDPRNYNFAYTDSLMKALEENGVEPFFRLGVTIDNPVKNGYPGYFIDPPKDYAKWARICEHIIRHYTEGWANGFRMKVSYWEIWNEPDNEPVQKMNPLWNASFSEFIRFYGHVAPYLKAKFPHLKIGGYSSCGFYAGVGAARSMAANSSSRLEYFVDCATNFLSEAKKNGWPLDFFSFHSYSSPAEALRQVGYADEMLNSYGFTREKTERIFNEWLCYVGQSGTALQAAGIAAELIGLQNSPCDLACIYDAKCGTGNYSPLFNPMTERPHRSYYAFLAFNELRRRGTAVAVDIAGDPDLYAAAARGDYDIAIFLANDSDRQLPLVCDMSGRKLVLAWLTDEAHTQTETTELKIIPPRSFILALYR